MEPAAAHPEHLDALLLRHLGQFLGDIEAGAMAQLREHLAWLEIRGGQTLLRQGDPGDAMYIVVSGRLRAFVAGDDARPRRVREMSRGQIVGEMSLYTGAPRAATLVASRDSVLVRLDKAHFTQLLAASPQLSIAITRQIIHRLQTETLAPAPDRPVAMALLPVSANVDLAAFAQGLTRQLLAFGRVAVVDAARLDSELGLPGITARAADDADANRRIAMRLDEIEASHDFVLLVADATPTPWTHRCSRHCDERLLLADADQPPRLSAIEAECLAGAPPHAQAPDILVLLHPADRRSPRDTAAWLARRPVADHVHLRPALERDLARLARLQSRRAVGLVLAGGGARGLAHLGVLRALQERGVEVDVVGGTSIGAVMAALAACDQPLAALLASARRGFLANPTGDFNLLPLLSLIKGRRLRRMFRQGMLDAVGFEPMVEDLWKGCYCVAANYSQATEQVLRRGPLLDAVLASAAIPGALPPLLRDGELLCDGGTLNNFPVDVMRSQRGVGRVYGVDLFPPPLPHVGAEVLPDTWALLRDRLRPPARRRYRLPSLSSYLMNATVLSSHARQRQARSLTDVYFNPPLEGVGMLQWQRFDHIVEQGYRHALAVLDADAAPPPATSPA